MPKGAVYCVRVMARVLSPLTEASACFLLVNCALGLLPCIVRNPDVKCLHLCAQPYTRPLPNQALLDPHLGVWGCMAEGSVKL